MWLWRKHSNDLSSSVNSRNLVYAERLWFGSTIRWKKMFWLFPCVCVCVWYDRTTSRWKKWKNRLERVVRTSGRIIGCELPSLASIYKQAVCGQSEENPRGCIPLCLYSILPASSLWQTIPKFSRVGLGASRTVISTAWSAPCPLKTICDDVHSAAVHVCCRCFLKMIFILSAFIRLFTYLLLSQFVAGVYYFA